MLCQNCLKNEATVHLTQIVDGKGEKFHFCDACAALKGIDVLSDPLDLSKIMEKLAKQVTKLKGSSPRPATSSASEGPKSCPACGIKRAEVLKKGRVGCDECYTVFAMDLLPIVVSMQHASHHSGKIPQRAASGVRFTMEQSQLRRELEKAIAAENYEQAASLRDQIRALGGGDAPS